MNEPRHDRETAITVSGPRTVLPARSQTAASTAPIGWDDCTSAARQWWWLALPAGLLLAVLAVAATWLIFEPKYEASAWLQIEEKRPFIAFPASDSESKLFVQTQVELIKSPLVLGEVLANPKIARLPEVRAAADAPFDWLSENLTVKSVGRSSLFQIAFKARHPEHAALITDAIMASYLEFMRADARNQADALIDVLEDEKGIRATQVEFMQEKVRKLAAPMVGRQASFGLGEGHSAATPNPLAKLHIQLADAEVERAMWESELEVYAKALEEQDAEVPQGALERALEREPQIRQLGALLTAMQSQLADWERTSPKGATHASAVSLKNDIELLEKRVEAAREKLRPVVAGEMREVGLRDTADAVSRLKKQIATQRLLEGLLNDRIDKQFAAMEGLGDDSLQLEIARGELQRAELVFQKISDRIMALRTEQSAPTRVVERRRAVPPDRPVDTPYAKLAAAGLAFFCLPFGLAVLAERRVRRIAEPQQISHETNLEVVGEITTLPTRSLLPGRRSASRFARHCSTFEESVENLGTHLMLSDELRQLQIIVVASAVSREGKTSLASQLAVSLANCSREVALLVDADLRAPDLHQRFGIPQSPGLVEVLNQEAAVEEAIVTSWSSRLHLLPAGRLNQNAQSLLGRGSLKVLLDQLRSRYRYIVVDAPPVLAASEALFIARAGDGTLLCT
ncbi:MAG: AAA family ATPase, partial [Pirellulales bacterium]